MKLPTQLDLKEIVGIGFLAGMGLTVSLVIAKITLHTPSDLGQVRIGLFIAAIISGLLGVGWLKRFPASL
jgi:NhaA family Na+:H+ antiporter